MEYLQKQGMRLVAGYCPALAWSPCFWNCEMVDELVNAQSVAQQMIGASLFTKLTTQQINTSRDFPQH